MRPKLLGELNPETLEFLHKMTGDPKTEEEYRVFNDIRGKIVWLDDFVIRQLRDGEYAQATADHLEIKDPLVETTQDSFSIISGICFYCDRPWTKKLRLMPNKGPTAVAEGKHTEADVYICDECDEEKRASWGRDVIITLYTRPLPMEEEVEE